MKKTDDLDVTDLIRDIREIRVLKAPIASLISAVDYLYVPSTE